MDAFDIFKLIDYVSEDNNHCNFKYTALTFIKD